MHGRTQLVEWFAWLILVTSECEIWFLLDYFSEGLCVSKVRFQCILAGHSTCAVTVFDFCEWFIIRVTVFNFCKLFNLCGCFCSELILFQCPVGGYAPQTARRDPGAVQRAAQRRGVHGEVSVPLQVFPNDLENFDHLTRDSWRNQSYDALQYQQEQFEYAVPEHQRAACAQGELSAAVATRRTAAQGTSRFSSTTKIFSEITSVELSDTLWFKKLQQRWYGEMLTMQIHSPSWEVNFSIIICMLKVIPLNFNKRSYTEGTQFRRQDEETRTANAGIANRCYSLTSSRRKLVTDVSTLQNRDTESQVQNHRQENARINARMNQTDHKHFDGYKEQGTRNWRSSYTRPMLKSAVYKRTPLICEFRWVEVNLPKIETQGIFEKMTEKIIPWIVNIFDIRSILNNQPSVYKGQKWNQRVFNLYGMARKILGTVGVTLQKKCIQQVSDLEKTTLLVAAHAAGITSQSTQPNFVVASAVRSSPLGFLLLQRRKETLCKKNKNNTERNGNYLRSYQPIGSLRNTIPTTFTPLQDYLLRAVLSAGRDLLEKCTKPWYPEKERSRQNWVPEIFELNKFAISKMNFKSGAFQQKLCCGSMKSISPETWTSWSRLIRCWDKTFRTSRHSLTADFKRRVFMEEQKAQQDSRFLKGHKSLTWSLIISRLAEQATLFLTYLRVQLKKNNVQGFDTKWDEVLLSRTKLPEEDLLWNLFKNSSITQRTWNLSCHCTCRIRCRTENWPVMLDWNRRFAGVWSGKYGTIISMPATKTGLFREQQHVKGHGKDTSRDRQIGDCAQWTSKGQCSRGESCNFKHDSDNKEKKENKKISFSFHWNEKELKEVTEKVIPEPKGTSPSGKSNKSVCYHHKRINPKHHPHVIVATHQNAPTNPTAVANDGWVRIYARRQSRWLKQSLP